LSTASAGLFAFFGLVGLSLGADVLVRGASRLAKQLGLSSLLIGLTVVAYGTSAPEIVASVVAAVEGYADVTIGNVVGSNIANMGLILGLTAIVTPLPVARSLLVRELPIMVAITFLLFFYAFQLELNRFAGASFLVLLVVFNWLSFRWARTTTTEAAARPPIDKSAVVKSLIMTVTGLAMLLGGAQLLVKGAVELARQVGLSELVIGITLVAVGTSLPELATSVVAGLRRETDLVVGNIIGSNLFNILGALGLSATIRPISIRETLLHLELPMLMVFTVSMAAFLYTDRKLVRWEGWFLIVMYALFIGLVLV
jgi:cation:H+ antiporter